MKTLLPLVALLCSLCHAQSTSDARLKAAQAANPDPECKPPGLCMYYDPGNGKPLIPMTGWLKIQHQTTPHKPAYWKQGLVDDLADQKTAGEILNIGPPSGGILMDCHYMNYWNGAQAEEAHFCYSPIPTEYHPVTAMLDESPLRLTFPHPCTADETNQNFGQGAAIPLAYCKDVNNHIPMCKPDSKPDEVCWEPR